MIKKIYCEGKELPKYSNQSLKEVIAIKIRADINDENFKIAFKNTIKKLDMVLLP